MQIINFTPHDINIVTSDGDPVNTYPASGVLARAGMSIVQTGALPDGTPMFKTVFETTVSMSDGTVFPAASPGTIYIVSALIANLLSGRDDIFVPGNLVRDDKGRVVGCQGLSTT